MAELIKRTDIFPLVRNVIVIDLLSFVKSKIQKF